MITRKCAISGGPNWVSWTQPVMTADVDVGGSTFGATASSYYAASSTPFHAFNNNEEDAWTTNNQRVGSWILFFNPSPLKVSALNVMNITTTGRVITGGEVQGSTDGATWGTLCTFTNSNTASRGAWTITVNSSVAYSYHRIYVTATNSSTNIGLSEIDIVATYQA